MLPWIKANTFIFLNLDFHKLFDQSDLVYHRFFGGKSILIGSKIRENSGFVVYNMYNIFFNFRLTSRLTTNLHFSKLWTKNNKFCSPMGTVLIRLQITTKLWLHPNPELSLELLMKNLTFMVCNFTRRLISHKMENKFSRISYTIFVDCLGLLLLMIVKPNVFNT